MWVSKIFVSSAIVALAIWLPFAFSTFTQTGTLTLTIPTLTAGTGTALTTTQIAALAGGLGLAAAAGLGALALASTLGGSSSSSSSSGYGHASSGYSRKSKQQKPRGIDWKRNLVNYGRGKREDSGVQLDFEHVFQKISAMDVNDCAKRYVCEISASPKDLLSAQDISTLSMFGQHVLKSKTTSAKYEYDMAWARGNTAENLETCKNVYKNCPVNGIAKFVSSMKHI